VPAINIVISGAAGFVSVNLLPLMDAHPAIAARYEQVLLVDPLQYGVQKIPPRILDNPRYRFVQGSIYDLAVADEAIGAGDLVIHLAAEVNSFTAPQAGSSDDPLGYLQRLADRGIGRLLFLSSADVYGVNDSPDLQETDPVRPTTIYAAAKAAFEAYLSAFHAVQGLPFVAFRPVTIYGPDQYPGWLVPRVITQAIAGEQISITGDGSVRRDWVFVGDVCDLLVKAALCPGDGICGQVFNVGTGHEFDVLSLTRYVLGKTGRDESLVTFVPERAGEIPRQVTSGARARAAFGWKPVTLLRDGLARTVDWYEARHDHRPQ
jgi:dTDP-glucose 4,6-dehydratase